MIQATEQLILIHFKSGGIQTGLLKTPLLSGKKIMYIPTSSKDGRRKFPRIPFIKDVKIEELGMGRAWDLSSRGMYIETLTPYTEGTSVPITIELSKETICLEAKVAYSDPGIGIGLKFQRLPIATRLKIESLIHQIPDSELQSSSKDRRDQSSDRRKRKLPSTAKVVYPKWKSRKPDRRQRSELHEGPPVELAFSKMKAIFFLEKDFDNNPIQFGSFPEKEPVILEFRDGEQMQGMLHEISPEAMGFFMDIQFTKGQKYTLFIVKSSIKSIRHLR